MPKTAAIEITEHDAKVVQLLLPKKGDVQLEHAFRVGFEDLPRGEEGQAPRSQRLKEALKQHHIATERVSLVVPKQSATVRKVRLPSSDPQELASMAAFEAEKIIPFNVERHIISHSLLRQHEIEGSDVLIAAVDEPVMQQWYGIAKHAGVEPVTSVVSALAEGYGLFRELDEKERKRSFALLQVGAVHTDISLYSEGVLVTTRSVMHGARNLLADIQTALHQDKPMALEELAKVNVLDPAASRISGLRAAPRPQPVPVPDPNDSAAFEILPADAEENGRDEFANALKRWMGKIATNLQRTYEFALREYSPRPIEKVYVTGEGALLEGITEGLTNVLGIPVERYNPLAEMPRAPKAAVDEAILPAFGTAYGAALELGLEDAADTINLLPPSVLEARRRSELRLHYFATGTMAVIALVIFFFWFDLQGNIKAEQIDRYTAFKQDLDVMVQETSDMKKRMEIIRNIRSQRAGALQILDSLSRYEPIETETRGGRITLDSFSFAINEDVRLTGQALETDDLNRFVQFLREMRGADGALIFQGVDITSQEPRELAGRNRTVYRFDIKATLRSRG